MKSAAIPSHRLHCHHEGSPLGLEVWLRRAVACRPHRHLQMTASTQASCTPGTNMPESRQGSHVGTHFHSMGLSFGCVCGKPHFCESG